MHILALTHQGRHVSIDIGFALLFNLFYIFMLIFTVFTVNSAGSSSSTKYDPDLLKADVALAKNRVARLRRDLEVVRAEFAYQQRGIDMLSQ